MYKDGNTVSIDLLHQEEKEQRNGLEIELRLKNNYGEVDSFYNAIKKQLVYFENLYFIDNTSVTSLKTNEFNNFNIKKYETFLVNDLDSNSREIDLVLGKVRYPLRLDSLTKHYPKYVEKYPVSLVFEIGDLEVTPNREEILYSQKNIEKIQVVLDKALLELDVIFNTYNSKNFTILKEYIRAIESTQKVPLLEIGQEIKTYITIDKKESKVTFKNIKYDTEQFLGHYNDIIFSSLIPVSYEVNNNKLVFCNSTRSLTQIRDYYSNTYLCDVSLLNNVAKTYIRSSFPNNSKFININKPIKHYIRKYFEHVKKTTRYSYNSLVYDSKICNIILKCYIKNIININKFSNASVPQSFIDKLKNDSKAKRLLSKNAGVDWSQNVNLFELRYHANNFSSVTSTPNVLNLSALKKAYRKTTIYGDKESKKLRDLFDISSKDNKVKFVEIAQTRQKLIKSFDNFINIDEIMSVKYKLIRQIGTAVLIQKELPFLLDLYKIKHSLGKISKKLEFVVQVLQDYNFKHINKSGNIHEAFLKEIYDLCLEKNYFDEDVRGLLNENLKLLRSSEKLLVFTSLDKRKIPDEIINTVVDYVLSRKLFRPDLSAVLKLKKETTLNIKNNENN